nr:hypothetical protein [uncultured Kingella sp.]
MRSNINLIIKNLSYDKESGYIAMFLCQSNLDKKIIAKLIYTPVGDSMIKGISSEEFDDFLMQFMNIENRREFLNKFFKTIFDYAENQDSVKFPVRII